MDHAAALELVYGAIDAANELRALDDQIALSPDVKLVGDGGRLDSLGLATLLMSIEQRIEDATGQSIDLLAEAVEDDGGGFGPLETLATLSAVIVQKLTA
jgi:hypothetical protein